MLEAAEALSHTSNSVDKTSAWRRLLTQPAAKGLLKGAGLLNKGKIDPLVKGLIGSGSVIR